MAKKAIMFDLQNETSVPELENDGTVDTSESVASDELEIVDATADMSEDLSEADAELTNVEDLENDVAELDALKETVEDSIANEDSPGTLEGAAESIYHRIGEMEEKWGFKANNTRQAFSKENFSGNLSRTERRKATEAALEGLVDMLKKMGSAVANGVSKAWNATGNFFAKLLSENARVEDALKKMKAKVEATESLGEAKSVELGEKTLSELAISGNVNIKALIAGADRQVAVTKEIIAYSGQVVETMKALSETDISTYQEGSAPEPMKLESKQFSTEDSLLGGMYMISVEVEAETGLVKPVAQQTGKVDQSGTVSLDREGLVTLIGKAYEIAQQNRANAKVFKEQSKLAVASADKFYKLLDVDLADNIEDDKNEGKKVELEKTFQHVSNVFTSVSKAAPVIIGGISKSNLEYCKGVAEVVSMTLKLASAPAPEAEGEQAPATESHTSFRRRLVVA